MNQQGNGPRRLDAYIRVSSVKGREGDNFISEKVQEERIRSWASSQGDEIIAVHHELDVSGGSMNRPKLNEVMARIDSGETDGVVVYNLSRFARTMVGSVELIHRINERGASFASVSDGFDITTISGRMVLGILLSITTAERERIGESWQASKSQAVGRGIHISANVPFGYVRGQGPVNPKTGKPAPAPLEVDPRTGPYVAEAFRRRAAGATWLELRDWLEREQAPTVRGATWHVSTVQGMIRNRVYLGIASGAGDMPDGNPGSHLPLTDEATWHAAQPRRGMRTTGKPPTTLLRGLVRCGSCRYTMNATKANGQYQYVCDRYMKGCEESAFVVAVSAARNGAPGLDEVVAEMMWEHLERIAFEGYDQALDLEGLEAERDELVARRDRHAEDLELEAALGTGWVKHLAALTGQVEQAQARIDETLRQLGRPQGRPLAELRADWESGLMSLEEKRRHAAGAIQAVFVNPANSRRGARTPELRRAKLGKRIHVVWTTDEELVDIPRQGKSGYVPRPWLFPDPDPDVAGSVLDQPSVVDAGDTVG